MKDMAITAITIITINIVILTRWRSGATGTRGAIAIGWMTGGW